MIPSLSFPYELCVPEVFQPKGHGMVTRKFCDLVRISPGRCLAIHGKRRQEQPPTTRQRSGVLFFVKDGRVAGTRQAPVRFRAHDRNPHDYNQREPTGRSVRRMLGVLVFVERL